MSSSIFATLVSAPQLCKAILSGGLVTIQLFLTDYLHPSPLTGMYSDSLLVKT